MNHPGLLRNKMSKLSSAHSSPAQAQLSSPPDETDASPTMEENEEKKEFYDTRWGSKVSMKQRF